MSQREDFMPDSGGFLDNMDGDIVEAIFDVASGEYADKVMAGASNAKPPVILTLTIESPDLDKPAKQSYSIGSQDVWEIASDGKSITNVRSPDKKRFRDGSIAWSLVNAMMVAMGEGSLEKGQDIAIKKDIFMTDAKFYENTSWHWEVTEIKRDIGGKTVTSRPPLPVECLKEQKPTNPEKVKPGAKKSDVDAPDLDLILISNAPGKDERGLKSFAVRNAEIKANDAYLKSVIQVGGKLKTLEDEGLLTKDPDSGKYI